MGPSLVLPLRVRVKFLLKTLKSRSLISRVSFVSHPFFCDEKVSWFCLFIDHWRRTSKKSRGNTLCRFLQCIRRGKMKQILLAFCSSKRNWNSYNITQQKHENNGSLTPWWHRLLWHCCVEIFGTITIYDLSLLRTTNINRSNKRS